MAAVCKPSEKSGNPWLHMKDGHGGVIMGSEMSGGVRNVFAENCKMDSPNLDRILRLKSNAERGGVIENVYMRNVEAGTVKVVLTIDLVYARVESGPFPPVVRNVFMEHVTTADSPRVLEVVGTAQSVITNIHLDDCAFHGVRLEDTWPTPGRSPSTMSPGKRPSRNSPFGGVHIAGFGELLVHAEGGAQGLGGVSQPQGT